MDAGESNQGNPGHAKSFDVFMRKLITIIVTRMFCCRVCTAKETHGGKGCPPPDSEGIFA